jgi:steroid 5-alpha reductase family enzyme
MAYATALFLFATKAKNNGYADVGYAGSFMVVTATVLATQGFHTSAYGYVLALMVFMWGIRLATRIHRKNAGKPEDFRYRAWREAWGRTFLWRSYLQIYILQATIAYTIALPVLATIVFPALMPWNALAYVGIALWVCGFIFESVGDRQLDRFLADPTNKGRIMQFGLWKYTRHPNYFGESVMWWGIALVAFGTSTIGAVVFVSPALITYLLLFVSGIPMLEKKWAGNPEWEAYKARTSAFIPLPPRRS